MPRHADDTPTLKDGPGTQTAGSWPWILGAVLFLGAIGLVSAIGEPHGPVTGLLQVLGLLARAGSIAAVYLLSAIGLGRLARPLFRTAADPLALQAGIGLSIQLTLSHLLGMAGLLAGPAGRVLTLALAALGLLLLAHQAFSTPTFQRWLGERPSAGRPAAAPAAPANTEPSQKQRGSRRIRWFDMAVLAPGLAIMLVAACSPPGWLWDSEFGGYDALSYHLQLPQEWLASGRLWPIAHNVYSYLPSYMEAAFLHVAALTAAPTAYAADGSPFGLLAGDGWRTIACQLLHTGFGVITAWLVARLVRRILLDLQFEETTAQIGARAAAVLLLLTPWIQVVGSLAYNELALTALLAAAMLAAWDRRLTPARRGLLAAWLIGVACGVKPTALMLGAPPVAILLIATLKPKDWAKAAIPGLIAGLIALSPWLIRNAIASGNPVFPAMTHLFGAGQWTADQAARFASGHQFNGSPLDRVKLLILPEPSPAGTPPDPGRFTHFRGLTHPQWSLIPFLLLIGAAGAIASRATRRTGLILTTGAAALITAWLFTTHLQSRFLIPLLIPGAALYGLVIAQIVRAATSAMRSLNESRTAGPAAITGQPRRAPSARGQLMIAALLLIHATLVLQAILAVRLFSAQQRQRGPDGRLAGPGHPNAALLAGPAELCGQTLRALRVSVPPGEWNAVAESNPTLLLNLNPPGEPVFILGDATPFYFTVPIRYTTTWDTNPLGQAIREHPDDPAAWTRSLFPSGAGLVLINFSEITRLQRSGWYDPIVTPEAIARWLQAQARPIHEWPEQSRLLARVSAGPQLPSAADAPLTLEPAAPPAPAAPTAPQTSPITRR